MKRFVICLDGTWQKLRRGRLTNIGIIARSVAHSAAGPDGATIPQIVIYSSGVGANVSALGKVGPLGRFGRWLNQMIGGIFGEGLEDLIVETYLRLAFNYEPGDEIYIFGFSRGAFAARSLAGLINCSGIVSRVHADRAWEAFQLYRFPLPENATETQRRRHEKRRRDFRRKYGKGSRSAQGERVESDAPPSITYLGVFDTVGQRGMPDALGWFSRLFNHRFGFHNLLICPNVENARHALAIDDRRLGFPPTLWQSVDACNATARAKPGADPLRTYFEQRWFVGIHGDVGGSNDTPLSAYPLKWIADGAAACGLQFYETRGAERSPLRTALDRAGFDAPITRPNFWRSLSPMNYPISPRRIWQDERAPTQAEAEALIDESAAMRAAAARVDPAYAPAPLAPFAPHLRELAARRLPPEELRP